MKAKALIEIEVELENEEGEGYRGRLEDIAANVCQTAAEYGSRGLSKSWVAKVLSVRCQYLESFDVKDL